MSQQHIIRVTAEHFKNVKVVDFMPNRFVTKISGANGAGKTSVLDVIFNALAPRKTLTPTLIRQGQKKGFIRIETNTHIITRQLNADGGSLQIEAKASSTLIKAPDDWLQGIAGELGFDPLRFMRLKPEEQFEVLRGLVELAADIDDLDVRNENDEETIKQHRAEIKGLEATLARIPAVDTSLPAEPVDIAALLQKSEAITAHNSKVAEEAGRRATTLRAKKSADEAVQRLKEELATAQARLDSLKAEEKAWEPLPELQDAIAVNRQVAEASTTNSAITANNLRRTQREQNDRDIDDRKAKMETLQAIVRERKLTIAKTLEQAKFPIPGLSFQTIEEGSSGRERKKPKKIVTYHGIPLTEASTAEQIRVSTAIGMAGKPDLRFLLIREGSLLDDNGWTILEQMAHEHNFQILAEVVDTSGKVGIFMQDGEIKAVNAAPEATAAPATGKGRKTRSKGKNAEQGELIK